MRTFTAAITGGEPEIIVDVPESEDVDMAVIDGETRLLITGYDADPSRDEIDDIAAWEAEEGRAIQPWDEWCPDAYDQALTDLGWVRVTPWDQAAMTCEVTPAPRMTSASFRARREHLGLPNSWLAAHLDVNERTIRKWDQGEARIPLGVSAEMLRLAIMTEEFVTSKAREHADPVSWPFEIPRTPRDLEEMTPVNDFPLDWWRNIGARLMDRVPGLWLEWIDFGDES